jgi:hypothetical protein
MKIRASLLAATLLLGAILGATLEARANSQIVTLTYNGALAAAGPQILGPGAAKRVTMTVIPVSPIVAGGPTTNSKKLEAVLVANAPSCDGAPAISVDGTTVACEWAESCVQVGESVTLCITGADTPIDVKDAAFYDSEGKFISKASTKVGNVEPGNCSPLDCTTAIITCDRSWPPNHKLSKVVIGGITSPLGPVTITATGVTQDEPVDAAGDGNTCPDAVIVDGTAWVRVERSGPNSGRLYFISFVASDGQSSCEGTVTVCIPKNKGQNNSCVDNGKRYNSLENCKPRRKCLAGDPGLLTLHAARVHGNLADIEYSLPAAGPISIGVYDVAGRHVATLLDATQEAGGHTLTWDVGSLPSGLYYYRLRTGTEVVSKTLLLTR